MPMFEDQRLQSKGGVTARRSMQHSEDCNRVGRSHELFAVRYHRHHELQSRSGGAWSSDIPVSSGLPAVIELVCQIACIERIQRAVRMLCPDNAVGYTVR